MSSQASDVGSDQFPLPKPPAFAPGDPRRESGKEKYLESFRTSREYENLVQELEQKQENKLSTLEQ